MRKVILTEDQMKLVSLIKESLDNGNRNLEKIKELKNKFNKMYTILMLVTIAEIRDGDFDLGTTITKFETYDDEYTELNKYKNDFEQRNLKGVNNWRSPEYEELFGKIDIRLYTVNEKLNAITIILDNMVKLRDGNLHEKFKDIKPSINI